MLRSEIITGIQALRNEIEKLDLREGDVEFYDNILCECRMLVLQNEANDPYAPHMRR
jgi:hypothetical protein